MNLKPCIKRRWLKVSSIWLSCRFWTGKHMSTYSYVSKNIGPSPFSPWAVAGWCTHKFWLLRISCTPCGISTDNRSLRRSAVTKLKRSEGSREFRNALEILKRLPAPSSTRHLRGRRNSTLTRPPSPGRLTYAIYATAAAGIFDTGPRCHRCGRCFQSHAFKIYRVNPQHVEPSLGHKVNFV